MAYEIIYECKSINNKNIREGELNILRAYPEKLYFEFGENEMNIKKRFYNDLETMNMDYEAILNIKEAEIKRNETTEIGFTTVDKIYFEEPISINNEEKLDKKDEEKSIKSNRRKKRF